jgi:hypothetical protein
MSGTDLYAGVLFNGVYKSANYGANWAPVNVGLPTGFNADFESLAVIGNKLFAGDLGGGVFLSTNNGAGWTGVNVNLTNPHIHALAVRGTKLFAGTDGGVFFSTNNGVAWDTMNVGLTDLNVQSLAVIGNNLFAGTGNGVFISDLGPAAAISEMQRENMHINIFPNPGNGAFQIKSDMSAPADIEIYNVDGQKIMTRTLHATGDDNTINISTQPSGIYFYRVMEQDRSVAGEGKLIIQK